MTGHDVARFTVLLPVNRPPDLLPFAIDSVLAQQGAEFELFVVCDSAPATVECAKAFAARDPRVRVFAFEKGERHGEAHRHTALAEARAPFVAQIGDDDLWFPDHLATLGRLLDRVDFGNLLQADLSVNGAIHVHTGDLADPAVRRRMLDEAFNFFGPSAAGYRLSAYRRLSVGWSPAPPDLWTDLYMWRKFLVREDFTFGTAFAIRLVKLSAQDRAPCPSRTVRPSLPPRPSCLPTGRSVRPSASVPSRTCGAASKTPAQRRLTPLLRLLSRLRTVRPRFMLCANASRPSSKSATKSATHCTLNVLTLSRSVTRLAPPTRRSSPRPPGR